MGNFCTKQISQFLHVYYLTFISQELVPNLFLLDGILFSEESKMSQGCERLQEIIGKKIAQVEQKEKQQIKKRQETQPGNE